MLFLPSSKTDRTRKSKNVEKKARNAHRTLLARLGEYFLPSLFIKYRTSPSRLFSFFGSFKRTHCSLHDKKKKKKNDFRGSCSWELGKLLRCAQTVWTLTVCLRPRGRNSRIRLMNLFSYLLLEYKVCVAPRTRMTSAARVPPPIEHFCGLPHAGPENV